MDRPFHSSLPIYSQLMTRIREQIVSGALPPGARLPSVRELAAQLSVNPNTVQRALQEMERGGLVYTQSTSGRYVTEDREAIARCREELAAERTADYLGAMEQLGFTREELIALLQGQTKEEEK